MLSPGTIAILLLGFVIQPPKYHTPPKEIQLYPQENRDIKIKSKTNQGTHLIIQLLDPPSFVHVNCHFPNLYQRPEKLNSAQAADEDYYSTMKFFTQGSQKQKYQNSCI